MSANRAHHRRSRRAARSARARLNDALPPGENFRMEIAYFPTRAEQDEAKQLTHDALIAHMGDTRTGPVTWIITEDDAALAMVGRMLAQPIFTAAGREGLETIRGRVRDEGGFFLIAMAPGDRPHP